MFSSHRWHFLALFIAIGVAITVPTTSGIAADWFWERVPPQIDQGSRTNAMRIVVQARSGDRDLFLATTRARKVLAQWRTEIEAAARNAKINEALIAALVMIESGGNPDAKSRKGALGLGQLMPETARRYGVRNSLNPRENLRGSAAYLSDLIDMFRGDLVLALAAYNSGEGTVLRYQGVPPYPETRAYVPRVLEAFEAAGRLCSPPPRAARRRCHLPAVLR
ncbi:MAG: lytic transglycosylase domain-containing protein [Rhodovibrionaceae bacterium]|nr:lytic transglycosylase domain-containing protein [Rhodovibrionaceae bacterium]